MFLKKLDKYILKKFLTTFFFSIALILMIFIVFDIKDKLPTFTTKDIALKEIVLDYYLMFIPYYGNFFSPVFIFISVIFFTSKMAQQTEFIAILSSGTSFNRVLRPYLMGAFIISFGSLLLNHLILPKAFKIKIGFEDKWINNNYTNDERNIHRKIGKNTLLYLQSYDNKINTGYKISLEEVVDNKQTYFLSADNMLWDSLSSEWVLTNVHERKITIQDRLDTLKNQKPIYHQENIYLTTKKMKLEFAPIDMWRDESKIETKTYFELKSYIKREKAKGSNRIELYEVEMYKRTSFPFATFILTIIGVCVSSRKVRGGVGSQIALGLFLTCIYIMLMYIFITIATTGVASPLLAVWVPNIIFSFVALYFYRTAQK
ncbi:LptF/LptG family permease [Aurantibacillus circumpalustris]|uniref:LptF/LptG family permease n=1 Tax=Aurantibacillus circumpalustris TaxID=3036359 RepID=UPI00295AF532|nr:LptF/LptG family permease [Aurantibacillus circumpalustris]